MKFLERDFERDLGLWDLDLLGLLDFGDLDLEKENDFWIAVNEILIYILNENDMNYENVLNVMN